MYNIVLNFIITRQLIEVMLFVSYTLSNLGQSFVIIYMIIKLIYIVILYYIYIYNSMNYL